MNISKRMIALCQGSSDCIHRERLSDDDGLAILLESDKLNQSDIKQLVKNRHDIDARLFKADTLRTMDTITIKSLCSQMLFSNVAFTKEIQRRL